MSIHRRDLFRAAAALSPAPFVRSALAGQPFWEKEPASAWSAKQNEQLRGNSPWARKAEVKIASNRASSMDHSGSRGTFGGMSGADSVGLSDSGPSRGGGHVQSVGGAPQQAAPDMQVVVCWVSAKPLIDSGATLPPAFTSKYALSVSGIPPAVLIAAVHSMPEVAAITATPGADQEKAVVNVILSKTTLSVKGHDPENAAELAQSPDHGSIIFGFDRQAAPITVSDHEVLFEMKFGALAVSARFEPRQMIYKGDLAL